MSSTSFQTFHGTVTTRGCELDRDSLIPPAMLLRYFEHFRWQSVKTSSQQWEVGSGKWEVEKLVFNAENYFVVVSQKAALFSDLAMEIELDGSMWISRVGRTSFEFCQELRRLDSNELVAQAVITAVYLNRHGKPSPLPSGITAHPSEEAWPLLDARLLSTADSQAWTRPPFAVRPSDLDLLRHVNHSNVFAWCDDTRIMAAFGDHYGSGQGNGRVRRFAIDYINQSVLGDDIQVVTWPIQANTFAFLVHHADSHQLLAKTIIETA